MGKRCGTKHDCDRCGKEIECFKNDTDYHFDISVKVQTRHRINRERALVAECEFLCAPCFVMLIDRLSETANMFFCGRR